eukprot:TRINITY_DN16029_c0_g2_i1.p1 TRINITY_DN16029_c0_g2~~TRINITY_DN16029_c0_g2_i1.p1  ORF type:complete len:227 (-),score=60.70 TRINITY_DN16029_c0_g2_i1:159-797(-)
MDCAEGLKYLHGREPPVAHLDIKALNVMMATLDPKATVVAKLIDFGTSMHVLTPLKERYVDNPIWLAPEILNQELYTEKVDIYSLGTVMYEVATRESYLQDIPWWSEKEEFVVSGMRPELPLEFVPPAWRTIVHACWHQSPDERLTAKQLVETLREEKEEALTWDKKYGYLQHKTLVQSVSEKKHKPEIGSTRSADRQGHGVTRSLVEEEKV